MNTVNEYEENEKRLFKKERCRHLRDQAALRAAHAHEIGDRFRRQALADIDWMPPETTAFLKGLAKTKDQEAWEALAEADMYDELFKKYA